MPSSAWSNNHRDRPSFPTRRSSDLHESSHFTRHLHIDMATFPAISRTIAGGFFPFVIDSLQQQLVRDNCGGQPLEYATPEKSAAFERSEEHTSELQSPCNLVCRLLLGPTTTEIVPPSLHDALPICMKAVTSRAISISTWPLSQPSAGRLRAAFSRSLLTVSSSSLCATIVGASRLNTPPQKKALLLRDRKSTRLNSSHLVISYAVFCLVQQPPRSSLLPYTTLFRSA